MPPRRTKIIATIGPATSGARRIERLIRSGADCLRFNFSHGSAEEHAAAMLAARAAARRAGRPVALLADLCGPKIRTGPAPEGGVRLRAGSIVELVGGDFVSSPDRVGVSYPRLARDVRPGQRVLMADGLIEAKVLRVRSGRVLVRVSVGGRLGGRKGVNLPGASLSVPALTAKDRRDLRAAARGRADYVALSFVRSPRDLASCRAAMEKAGLGDAGLIAKIEKPEAVERIGRILEGCDGIMVARGDLGVEMHAERIPALQRRLAALAAERDKLCIVATEMLESMVSSPRPTRAEVSDVAAAVRDGADAAMLSAETSVGRFPEGAVRAMARVLSSAEGSLASSEELSSSASWKAEGGETDILALAAGMVSRKLDRAVLVAATESGRTALFLSKSRPASTILGMSPHERALSRMALYWGVHPVQSRPYKSHARLLEAAEREARRLGARKGSVVVILSGTPLGTSGRTNTLHLRKIGA